MASSVDKTQMYRSSTAIMVSVLDATRQRTAITMILHKANIPHPRAKKILADLVSKQLISASGEQYIISPLGLQFLDEHRKFREFASGFGLEI